METTDQSPNLENSHDVNSEYIELQKQEVVNALRGTASWFYWIAGLSILNTILAVFEKGYSFFLGLGMTQVVDAFILAAFGSYNIIGWIINILINGLFVFFGIMFTRHHEWALIGGMAVYALDAIIFLVFQDWLPLLFHFFVLYKLYQGFETLKTVPKPYNADQPINRL